MTIADDLGRNATKQTNKKDMFYCTVNWELFSPKDKFCDCGMSYLHQLTADKSDFASYARV